MISLDFGILTSRTRSSRVDLVYKDGEFEEVIQERFSKSLEDKPKKNLPKGTKLEDLF